MPTHRCQLINLDCSERWRGPEVPHRGRQRALQTTDNQEPRTFRWCGWGVRLAPDQSPTGLTMPLIHHVITGQGRPPIVFVHGFGCSHSDWNAQVAHFSQRHQTVAVDLRGHGASPGTADECSIEEYGTRRGRGHAGTRRAAGNPCRPQHGMPCGSRGRLARDSPCSRRRPGRWQPVRPGYGSYAA